MIFECVGAVHTPKNHYIPTTTDNFAFWMKILDESELRICLRRLPEKDSDFFEGGHSLAAPSFKKIKICFLRNLFNFGG